MRTTVHFSARATIATRTRLHSFGGVRWDFCPRSGSGLPGHRRRHRDEQADGPAGQIHLP
ncbi:MAG: hypothetical protein NT062_09355 [Proteobacteria bacterium]|nr:hypothetical protein [Pseudomonadota bacterium]